MDNVKRSALTALGLVGLVVVAAGSKRHSSSIINWDAGYSTSSSATAAFGMLDASTATVASGPDPTTDYKSIDDVKLDGAKAYGKTLLLKVWRGSTDPQKVTLYACGKGGGGFLEVSYAPEKRDLVKAIPATITLHGDCPRVVVKITGKQEYTSELKGEIAQILDVAPAPPPVLPPGIDYVTMDDINFDGKKAAGKIAVVKAYRGNTEEKKFTAYPCGASGGLNFIYVNFTPDQKDMVKDLSTSFMTCQPIKVKLTTQQPYTSTWNAQLLEVQKGE